jgi:hypothetical protein
LIFNSIFDNFIIELGREPEKPKGAYRRPGIKGVVHFGEAQHQLFSEKKRFWIHTS